MSEEDEPNIEADDNDLEPGAKRTFSVPKRGIWTSSGPQGQENPEAEILGEEKYKNGDIYYQMRGTDGHIYYAPKVEVRLIEDHVETEDTTSPEQVVEGTPAEATESIPEPAVGTSITEPPIIWRGSGSMPFGEMTPITLKPVEDEEDELIEPPQPFHDFWERTRSRYDSLSTKKKTVAWAIGIPLVANLFGIVGAGVIKTGLKREDAKMEKYLAQLKEREAQLQEQQEPDPPQAII